MLRRVERTGHETAASKSVVRQLRTSLLKWSNLSEEMIEVIFAKKGKVVLYKMRAGEDHKAEHVVVDKQHHFVFIEEYCIPVLKTVHTYPDMYPRFTADAGAIKFMIKGANLMAPGLIKEGEASMDEVKVGAIVSIYVFGHEHCVAIGITRMTPQKIRQTKEGMAVEVIHFIGDSIWSLLYR